MTILTSSFFFSITALQRKRNLDFVNCKPLFRFFYFSSVPRIPTLIPHIPADITRIPIPISHIPCILT